MDDLEKGTCESLQIPALMKDIGVCINKLKETPQCIYRSHYEDVIKQGRYQLLSIIRQIKEQDCRKPPLVPKEDIERDIFMTEMETKFEETKIAHVRNEWIQQQKHMAKLQECLYKKCRILSLHSSYSSRQGSSFSAILAVLMENQELVEAYLSEPDRYLINFIKIANGCLFSFVKTYAYDVPLEDSTDYRYILTLYTCIVHISNLPRGRQFLIKQNECQNLLSELIYIVPHIKHATAKTLKIILLNILHNITKEADGLNFLRQCSEMISTLDNCIRTEYDPSIHKHVLEILERITKEIPNKECLDKITKTINTQRLNELSGQMYREVNHIPRKILQNIKIAADKILAQEQAQGDVLRSKSAGSMCKSTKSVQLEKKRSAPSPERISSKQKIRISQNDHGQVPQKSRSSVKICKPSSAQSTSSYISTTEFSDTPPSRDTPQRRSRPVFQTALSAPSPKPVTVCTSPCRYIFPNSPCVCKSHCSREHPTNIPVRRICISPSIIREKKTECSIFSNISKNKKNSSSFSPCYRTSSGARPSSGSRPSSNDRLCSGNRSYKIKEKIMTSFSANKKICSLSQKSPCVPSCSTASTNDKVPSTIGTSSVNKPSLVATPSADDKKLNKLSCVSSCKNEDKSGPIPTVAKSSGNKPDNKSSCNNKPSSGKKKAPCSCTKTSKHKKMIKAPSAKTSRRCESSCKGSCKHHKPKVSSLSDKETPKPTKPCSCASSTTKCPLPDSKPNGPSFSESELKPTSAKSTPKQTFSEIERKKPKYMTSTKMNSSPDMKSAVSFSKSIESKTSSIQPFEQPKVSHSKEEIKTVTCAPSCTSSFGHANTATPAKSSPSINASDCEKEICTCGSISERRLLPWSSENRMVARLSEMDRRVHHVQNTIRVVSRLDGNCTGRTQRVVTRIKIPGLRFQRMANSQGKQ